MGMFDDIVYVCLLASTIGVSYYMRQIKNRNYHQWISSAIGLIVVLLVSGVHALFPIFMVVVNYLILVFFHKRSSRWISFVFCFALTTIFRMCPYLNIAKAPDHANAIMMMLCLKMIGLAFEIESQTDSRFNSVPSFFDVCHYAFCHAGVLVGPYYKYRTYIDMVEWRHQNSVPYVDYFKERAKFLPFYTILFLIAYVVFPIDFITSGEIYDSPLSYRLFYMWPIFFTFRMRMYVAFILGECNCIMAGIGCYPEAFNPRSGNGPQEYDKFIEWNKSEEDKKGTEYSFETVRSVNEYNCELLTSMRHGMRNWNMTIQYWLAIYIFKQIPIKFLKVPVTMFTSALWHGINPGYYLCLMNVPLVLFAQDKMEGALKPKLNQSTAPIYNYFNWLFTLALFSYLSTSFLLLNSYVCLTYWTSIYFFGHLVIIAMYVIGLIFQ